jgi:hypothetical protein
MTPLVEPSLDEQDPEPLLGVGSSLSGTSKSEGTSDHDPNGPPKKSEPPGLSPKSTGSCGTGKLAGPKSITVVGKRPSSVLEE